MPTTLVQRLVIALCLVAMLAVPLAGVVPSEASDTSTYRWAVKQTPFTVMAGANLSGEWPSIMRTAVKAWDKNETVFIKQVSGG
ncbi:MAG: hypothetical protein KC442_25455, partial [Thermomicrobiales bacterium]|nr:hypothetical protein [Thermomicrobiales bacterium]